MERVWIKCASPSMIWEMPGRILICWKPIFFNVSYICFKYFLSALGMAIIASSARLALTKTATSLMGPMTGILSIFLPIFSGSSSRKAATSPNMAFETSSFAIARPANPAPIMNKRFDCVVTLPPSRQVP
jgi:hypothetical protein